MKRYNVLFKNVFTLFLSICLLSAGLATLFSFKEEIGFAENTVSETLPENNLHETFSKKEQIFQSDAWVDNPASFIDDDVFVFVRGEEQSNRLELSLKTNGATRGNGDDVYNFVYYPDVANPESNLFYFYDVTDVSLFINGEDQEENFTSLGKTFITHSSSQFSNYNGGQRPNTFRMVLGNSGTENYEYKITDDSGRLNKEGIYNLQVTMVLFTCTNGRTDAEEEQSDFEPTTAVTINYTFFVVDETNYISQNRPVITKGAFDHELNIAGINEPAYYLYSNYSSKINSAAESTLKQQNSVPYIQYDCRRFEVEISKEVPGATTTPQMSLKLNVDPADRKEKPVLLEKQKLVEYVTYSNSLVRLYFTDIGKYTIKFNAIHIVGDGEQSIQKYDIAGLSKNTREVVVFMFGYQATYVDYDAQPDENNTRPSRDLKTLDLVDENGTPKDIGTFLDSADVTSEFLNSKSEYTQDNGETTFNLSNVLEFLNEKEGDAYKHTPISTNQAPIRMTTNARLVNNSVNKSYILSTRKLVGSTLATSGSDTLKLQGEDLYVRDYDNTTESGTGKYIYIIPYTFENYYESYTSPPALSKVFYQIFFFEIENDLPEWKTETKSGNLVFTGSFVNEDVIITDTTIGDAYNKDVTIQIYAYDYVNKRYLDEFLGDRGKSLDVLCAEQNEEEGKVVLSKDLNATFTLRLYYSSEMPSNTSISNTNGVLRTKTFTIDSMDITSMGNKGISARTVEETYSSIVVLDTLEPNRVFTNQNIVLSWDEKASGAKTSAYYRYFPFVDEQYYNTPNLSELLGRLLEDEEDFHYMPINKVLNMSTSNNDWTPYARNTKDEPLTNIPSDAVFSDAGLYLVEVFDQAGNYTLDVFVIDDTKPMFAIKDNQYYLPSYNTPIDKNSTLYWGTHKLIYIANFNTSLFANNVEDPSKITDEMLSGDPFFQDKDKQLQRKIYELLYEKLFKQSFFKNITISSNITKGEGSTLIDSYTGLYVAVPINNVAYYIDNDHRTHTRLENAYKKEFVAEKRYSFKIWIRDYSNTTGYNSSENILYTQYYSATQAITISFDTSEFKISYKNNDTPVALDSVITEEGVAEDDERKTWLTTYIGPVGVKKILYVSFKPVTTFSEGDKRTEVDSVTMKYWAYVPTYDTLDVKGEPTDFHYYSLSKDAEEQTFEFTANEEVFEAPIRSSANYTAPGKYEITRTYKLGDNYTFNEKDAYQFTYVFYVDHYGIVTSAESYDGGPLESMVGGDIFVASYDNKVTTDLVVTFPNSEEGNTDGTSTYNNDPNNLRPVVTTNKLPVNVYVPQFKYTKYVQKNVADASYDFSVENNGDVNNFKKDENDRIVVQEFALYAEIYKDGLLQQNLVAKTNESNAIITSSNGNPIENSAVANNGFLKFYSASSNTQEFGIITAPGDYYVKIYQNRFGTHFNDNTETGFNFDQTFVFKFVVTSSTPDFEVQAKNGEALNSTVENGITTYYTNQSEVTLTWAASANKYMAEIDQDAITFTANGTTTTTSAEDGGKRFWSQTPELQSNSTWAGILSFAEQKLNVYRNGGEVLITMQYQNYETAKDTNGRYLYSKITKKIKIDLSAPSDNVEGLVDDSLSGNMIPTMTKASLRDYKKANGQKADSLDETSFNTSNKTDSVFAYYSYNVSSTYLQKLKNSQDYVTYIRDFNNTKYDNNYEQETDASAPLINGFSPVDEVSILEEGHYYEVVETDLAGNRSIYTIFISSRADESLELFTYTVPDEEEDETTGSLVTKAYTVKEFNLVASRAGAINNIYSHSGFKLEKLNFFGDVWAQMLVHTFDENNRPITLTVLSTPKGYRLYTGSVSETVDLASLVPSNFDSHKKMSFAIYDRQTARVVDFYLNISDVPLTAQTTDQQDREFIRFAKVTDAEIQSTTTPSLYLTHLKISRKTASGNEVLFEQENPLGYMDIWRTDENLNILVDSSGATLNFELNPEKQFAPNTWIIYDFWDNYGQHYREIHIYREAVIDADREIASQGGMYDIYYYLYEPEGRFYYITQNFLQYTYNREKYNLVAAEIINGTEDETLPNVVQSPPETNRDGTSTITFQTKNAISNYDFTVVLKLYELNGDVTGEWVKNIYFKLYNKLPTRNATDEVNRTNQYKLTDANNKNITQDILNDQGSSNMGYYSEVRVQYNLGESENSYLPPVKFSISTDRENWTPIASGTRIRSTTNEMQKYFLKIWYDEEWLQQWPDGKKANSEYVFGIVPDEQILEFNLTSLAVTYWVEKTVNGVTAIVERAKQPFKAKNGELNPNHYIVNLSYDDRSSVSVQVNNEQSLIAYETDDRWDSADGMVTSKKWVIETSDESIKPSFRTEIIITFIPDRDDFVDEFFAIGTRRSSNFADTELRMTSEKLVVSDENLERVQLQWSKYYGIPENEISLIVEKDGVKFTPTVYSKTEEGRDYFYTNLNYSGKYSLSLRDAAGNMQRFGDGQTEKFTYIFLKDVPFTVTYTNPLTNQQETSLPIKQAVYNGSVTINIDQSTLTDFYTLEGRPVLYYADPENSENSHYLVKRNGVEYAREDFRSSNAQYVFDQPGFYEITFLATSNTGDGQIRQETYQFSIINANENKFSYIVNKYPNYYVEQVLKVVGEETEQQFDDITNDLVRLLDVETITKTVREYVVNESTGLGSYVTSRKTYITSLPLSYLDEKTGAGTYFITVNTGDTQFAQDAVHQRFTFKISIKVGTASISVSVGEGATTTDPITVRFNQANIYKEMGECSLRVLRKLENGYSYFGDEIAINEASSGELSMTINTEGTYYVQLIAPSGNLLFTYKVVKKDPMNAASIIAIVISVLVVIAVVVIIIKLRKRISVK